MKHPCNIAKIAAAVPFTFAYGGRSSRELLPTWPSEEAERQPDDIVRERVVTWRDPRTALAVTCEVKTFSDFPAVEWVLRFENCGSADTPLLEDVFALDAVFGSASGGQPVLHHARGSTCQVSDFEPMQQRMDAGLTLDFAPRAGRSSDPWLPFFNLEWEGAGVIIAIGWSGQWAAQFRGQEQAHVGARAGVQDVCLKLHPGEHIRTPRILLLSWTGRFIDGQNALRQLLLSHYVPRTNGGPVVSPISCAAWGADPAHEHLEKIELIAKHKLPFDVYWIDAGWYGTCKPHADVFTGDWARNVGSWDVNPELYPDGMDKVSKAAHAKGMRYLLWFEPERAHQGSYLFHERPQWLLGAGEDRLFDFGNPDALRWMTDHVSGLIESVGIDIYRNDYNIDPLPFWQAAEEPDRKAMPGIRWVEGFYTYWDELLRRHPGLVIDDCASGGRVIDLEALSRSIPLWRSDLQCDPKYATTGSQCHSYGIMLWVPLSTTGCVKAGDTYEYRSCMSSSICTTWSIFGRIPDAFPYDWAREMLEQMRTVRPYYYGDYYPLTPYSAAEDAWMAYQFHRPDLGEGMVMAFRRAGCGEAEKVFRLDGLSPDKLYEVTCLDTRKVRRYPGRKLLDEGLPVRIEESPGSALLVYSAER